MSVMDTKHDFKLFRDTHDSWGSTMGLWFSIASELWWRGEVPAGWDYSPGAASDPRDPDDYFFELIYNESTEDLISFGEVLQRHARFLRFKGCDY